MRNLTHFPFRSKGVFSSGCHVSKIWTKRPITIPYKQGPYNNLQIDGCYLPWLSPIFQHGDKKRKKILNLSKDKCPHAN